MFPIMARYKNRNPFPTTKALIPRKGERKISPLIWSLFLIDR